MIIFSLNSKNDQQDYSLQPFAANYILNKDDNKAKILMKSLPEE